MVNPGFLWTLASFMLVIGPLIFIHEMGHYLVGRWCGVKAECFSIGFGRELIGLTDRRGTRWKLSLLPLGGYVRFAGDMNPASTPSTEWLALPAAERNRTFQAKKIWQRFLIVLAGPATNFLFAFLVFAALFATFGELSTPAVVTNVVPGSAAQRAGVQVGDRITMIDHRGVSSFEDVVGLVALRPAETVAMDVYRQHRQVHLTATIGVRLDRDRFGNESRLGQLGAWFAEPPVVVHLKPWQVPGAAARIMTHTLDTIISVLRQIVMGERSLSELHGPVGTATLAGEVATLGWFNFICFMASISINLGFINLLPIPMLDGGHLMFYTIEAVKRRPVRRQVQDWAFRSGLAVLVAFMVVVTAHDLAELSVWHDIAGLIARG